MPTEQRDVVRRAVELLERRLGEIVEETAELRMVLRRWAQQKPRPDPKPPRKPKDS
jgi:hypothetical protein